MEFTERYKEYPNTELLRIINNSQNYRSDAVEAAKIIFEARQLSDNELEIAEKELEAEKQVEIDKKAKQDRIKKSVISALSKISPIQNKRVIVGRVINILSIILGGIFCYKVYKEAQLIKYLFKDIADWDFSVIPYFLLIIIVPLSVILFYMRKRIGWIILIICLIFMAVPAFMMIIVEIHYLIVSMDMPPLDINESLLAIIEVVEPVPITDYIFPFLFYAGIILIVCKENIRIIYSISRRTMFVVLVTTALPIVGFMFNHHFL